MAKPLLTDELWEVIEPLLPKKPPKPKGAEEARYQEPDSQEGTGEQRAIGAASLGGGAPVVLAKPPSALEGALREASRPSPSVSRSGVRASLLKLRPALL